MTLPLAMARPTVAIRVYDGQVRDGIRQRDLTVYKSATFTRTRNTVTTFEVVLPLVPQNLELAGLIRENWLIEFWSEAPTPRFLFGGFVTSLRWFLDEGKTSLAVRGLSYLAWIAQRRIIGGTGSLAWSATTIGLETGVYKPPVNQLMWHAARSNPNSFDPPGTREHWAFRVPDHESISQISDAYSTPTLPSAYAIPRLTATEITAFLSGVETLNYLAEKVGDRANEDTSSVWFGMPRVSYDIIRYDGAPFGVWPTNALYLVIRVPGLGVNRSVGNQTYHPIIFDVAGGGVAEGEYIEDSSEVRNHMYVLGAGEKATRARYEYSDGDSIIRYGRIEDVVDAGQESNVNVVSQKGNDALNDKRNPKVTAKFRLSVIPGQVFGYDFFFDDVVTVYWEEIGLTLNDFVTSVTLNMGDTGDGASGIQDVQLSVGSEKLAQGDAGSALGRYLNGLKRGITNIRV